MIIRKIAVGPDYKSAMHFVVGQDVANGRFVIDTIVHNSDTGSFEVWVKDTDGLRKWKEFNDNTPVHIEYNTNY
jgi:hypothetical protein